MSHEKISSLISDNSRIDGEEDQIDRSSSTLFYKEDNDKSGYIQNNVDNEDLGPLPPKWEKAMTENGEVYFIDHSSGTSHWLDPRLSKFQKKSLEDCLDDELPYGWEKISDPQYGTYFIDHVNRRTQYENPVIQAKRAAERGLNACSGRASFTRDPSELCGQRFTTALLKSSRGLGFTIVGGDDDVDEFLQIKSVVPNGPAWLDGKLQTGDLIVYVNDTCVLGYTHNQIVHLFQSISPGETVVLEVCRGYSLPFDPNDPNTEVVTTIAVDGNIENAESEKVIMDLNRDLSSDRNYNFLDSELNQSEELLKDSNCNVNSLMNSTDGVNNAMKELSISPGSHLNKNIVNISIVKGTLGFGFTIADSACGQRVKKILDRQRCKNLLEGDILMEINSINVQEMSHDDVVQVLKNCPYNEEAVICVQRGPVNTKANPNKNKNRKLENGRFSKDITGAYRSKTPTADLYSTQQKEVLPSRPKTPLVDTRTRIKTPLGDMSAANSTTSSKSLRREEVSGLFNYDGLSESSPYQLVDNPGLSCSQNDISVNLNDHACKPLYGNYDGSIYGRYNVHVDTCFCYECKQIKLRPVNDFRAMHIDTNTYEGCDYVNRNLDRRKDMIGYDYRDPTRQLDNWHWVAQNGQMNGEYVDCLVTLVRQETGFGFRIVGGTEEGSQVAVGHVVPGGAADLDGRINTGDEILSVDGHSVLKASHHQVVQLMGGAAARGRVTLRIRRRLHHIPIQHAPTYDVVVHRSENEGFGFVIISSVNKVGSTIGRLIEGSPAERCGQLHVGDHIVAVNHIDITNLCHGDIVNLIKDSGYSVTLTIGPPLSDWYYLRSNVEIILFILRYRILFILNKRSKNIKGILLFNVRT